MYYFLEVFLKNQKASTYCRKLSLGLNSISCFDIDYFFILSTVIILKVFEFIVSLTLFSVFET